MKYVVLCLVVIVLCFALMQLITHVVHKKQNIVGSNKKSFLNAAISGILLLIALGLSFFAVYSHAGEKAKTAMKGSETVSVTNVDGGYFFDGPGEEQAIVLYPGAKVESTAYAPLMLKFAASGVDCFLAEMPFNFAAFGSNVADKFIGNFSYDTWILAGHSMGGVVAAKYATTHADAVDGVILLAAYPTVKIDDSIWLYSIYGSEDGCLDVKQYENGKKFWPANSMEFILDGANHAQFGDYGEQNRDGTAIISAEEQQDETVQLILEFLQD